MTKNLLFAVIVLGLFSVAAPNVYGCSCVVDEVPDAFREAQAVFVGEVVEIIQPRSHNPKAPLENQLYAIKFKVEKSWKGVHTSNISVLSDQGRAGCFSWGPFIKGKKYLVYAERQTPSTPTRNLAVLFSCNRTDLVGNASEDLQKLPTFLQKTWARK